MSALDQVAAAGSADAARPELAQVLHALADGDVSQVLVALGALLAGGWGPQQLATELIDDLRQVFLSALAPELCAASGSSLERFTEVAETMGLPRVVRSMEILGHTLVDIREAPDAQVVLEIAVVRAVRPDLDSGMEALTERVSLLERSLSGGAAFPRPGAATEPAAPGAPAARSTGARPVSWSRPRGRREASVDRRAAAEPAGLRPSRGPAGRDCSLDLRARAAGAGRRFGARTEADSHDDGIHHRRSRSGQPDRGLGRRDPARPPGPCQGAL